MKTKRVVKPRKLYEEPEVVEELISVADIDEYIKNRATATEKPPFKPCFYYHHDGDFIDVWLSEEPSWSEQLDNNMVIMRKLNSEKVVGIKLYGIKKLIGLIEIPTPEDKEGTNDRG